MGTPVHLFVYDLSNGLARALSPQLLGRTVEGIYHTSIVVRGRELFFGAGVCLDRAGQTQFGQPERRLLLGSTQLDDTTIDELVHSLSMEWNAERYNLLHNNCTHFADALAQLLVGSGIPAEFTRQAELIREIPALAAFLSPAAGAPFPLEAAVPAHRPAPAPQLDDEESFAALVRQHHAAFIASGCSNDEATELAVEAAMAGKPPPG